MSQLYFKYRVTTQISIQIDERIEVYAITLCVRMTDVLDYERLNTETGKTWNYSRDERLISKYKKELTLGEIFTYTPAGNETVSSVRYRMSGSYRIFEKQGMTVLESEKFLYSEFICYKISLKEHLRTPMRHADLTVTTNSPGLIYEIKMSDKLSLTNYLMIALAPAKTHPRRSMRFIPVIMRGQRNDTAPFRPIVNYFSSQLYQIRTQYLPAPYETDCCNYNTTKNSKYRTQAICEHNCMDDHVTKQLAMVTFTSFVSKPRDMKLIVDPDALGNKTQLFHQIRDHCLRNVCRKRDCRHRISLTTTTAIPDPVFRIRVMAPNIPSIVKETFPKTDFIEFFTFVSSNISTWLGVYILWFDPANLVKIWKKKMAKKRKKKTVVRKRKPSDEIDLIISCMSVMNKQITHIEQTAGEVLRMMTSIERYSSRPGNVAH